jgi:hypothetical protein
MNRGCDAGDTFGAVGGTWGLVVGPAARGIGLGEQDRGTR